MKTFLLSLALGTLATLLACTDATNPRAFPTPPPAATAMAVVVTPVAFSTRPPPTPLPTMPLSSLTALAPPPATPTQLQPPTTGSVTATTTPTATPEPPSAQVVVIPAPSPAPVEEPRKVSLTPLQEYSQLCASTLEKLLDDLPPEGEATWRDFRHMNQTVLEEFEGVDPPPELRDYHEYRIAVWEDLIEMVYFAYDAVNLEGIPMGIEEATLLQADEVWAIASLFALEVWEDSENNPVREHPWPTLDEETKEELISSGCESALLPEFLKPARPS